MKKIKAIHKKHKKILDNWKEYRANQSYILSDDSNHQLDKFINDLANVLSDLNKYIECGGEKKPKIRI